MQSKSEFFRLIAVVVSVAVTSIFGQIGGITGTLNWSISNSTLIISGAGDMPNYNSDGNIPWYNNRNVITKVEIGDSVTSIGERAFSSCIGLTEVEIGDSVTSIGEWAFGNCRGLTSIVIPNSVTVVSGYAFYGCSGLTSVVISDLAVTIGSYAFYDCSSLTEVIIPNSVTSIGSGAFQLCSKLTSINVKENNINYASVGGVLFNKSKTTLITYPYGKIGAYIVPNSVTSIGERAFSSCIGLTAVIIPYSVTYIGDYVFENCSGLISIVVAESNNNYASVDGVLFNKTKTTLIKYPNGKTGVYTIPNSVNKIGYAAFEGCSGLTEVVIPNSVTEIDYSAFGSCKGLVRIINRAAVPQATNSYAFQDVYTASIKLYVPAQAVNTYKADNVWKYFNVEAVPLFVLDNAIVALAVDAKKTLEAVFDEEYDGDKTITWRSDNIAVASVNNEGTITAVSVGTANITATIQGGFSDVCAVNVVKATGTFKITGALGAVYSPKLKLGDVALPADYVWNVPSTALNAGDGQTFAASYTDPSGNYTPATGNVVVNVAKATPDNVPSGISVTYSPKLKLGDVVLPADYVWNVPSTPLSVGGHQFFAATFINGSGNYITGGYIAVSVEKANPAYEIPVGLTATYGQKLTNVPLSDGLSWMYPTVLVGSVGTQTHLAKFTSADTANYNVVENIPLALLVSATTHVYGIPKNYERYGIKLTNGNIVSDKAEFSVVLPNDKSTDVNIIVYDNTGNVVFEKSEEKSDNEILWDLTNLQGRKIANGSYLIIVQAKGNSGKIYRYSVKIGVRR